MKRSDFIRKTAMGMTTLAFSTISFQATNSKKNQRDYNYQYSGKWDDGSTLDVYLKGELKKGSVMDFRFKSNKKKTVLGYTFIEDFKPNKKIKVTWRDATKIEGDTYTTIHLNKDNPYRKINRIKVADKMGDQSLTLYTNGKKYLKLTSSKEGCYLTTACTENRGLPDDCYELETLRGFRDNILRKNKNGREIIDEYYATAPAIVSIIHSIPEKNKYLNFIYEKLVLKTIELVEKKEFELAQEFYISFTRTLHSKII